MKQEAQGTMSEGTGATRERRDWWSWVSGPELLVSALALLLGAAVFAWAHKDEGRLRETKEAGAEIVDALHRYHAQTGDYPATLDRLIPAYLDSIEAPTWGRGRWHYERISRSADATADPPHADNAVFMLSVAANASGYPLLFYDVTARRWVLNN